MMMATLIIKSYLTILLFVGTGSVFIFLLGLYWIFRNNGHSKKCPSSPVQQKKNIRTPLTITSHDIHSIAGDDVIATQLDLARAYIETDRKQLAKKILNHVMKQGSDTQQKEARQLLTFTSLCE